MIQGKWLPQGSDISEAVSIRGQVFGLGRDQLDDESWNTVVYQDDVPAASGRLWWKDGAFHIGDIGVLSDYRGRRLGDLTLRLLLFKAQSHFAREVRLICPSSLVGFFSRLGFREDERETRELSGQRQVSMFLPGDEINLDTCASCKKANCPSRQGPEPQAGT